METKDILDSWRKIQNTDAILPCPRCGKMTMDTDLLHNALSRRADVYICNSCGIEEAMEDFSSCRNTADESRKKTTDSWFAVKVVYGKSEAEKVKNGFEISARTKFVVTEEDIDDIMAGALEGGIAYWCGKAEVVGEYLGEFASEQISKGGSLKLYDSEEGAEYTLTLEKFLNGMKLFVEQGYDRYNAVSEGNVDTCEIDGEMADCIIQLALFSDVIYG